MALFPDEKFGKLNILSGRPCPTKDNSIEFKADRQFGL